MPQPREEVRRSGRGPRHAAGPAGGAGPGGRDGGTVDGRARCARGDHLPVPSRRAASARGVPGSRRARLARAGGPDGGGHEHLPGGPRARAGRRLRGTRRPVRGRAGGAHGPGRAGRHAQHHGGRRPHPVRATPALSGLHGRRDHPLRRRRRGTGGEAHEQYGGGADRGGPGGGPRGGAGLGRGGSRGAAGDSRQRAPRTASCSAITA